MAYRQANKTCHMKTVIEILLVCKGLSLRPNGVNFRIFLRASLKQRQFEEKPFMKIYLLWNLKIYYHWFVNFRLTFRYVIGVTWFDIGAADWSTFWWLLIWRFLMVWLNWTWLSWAWLGLIWLDLTWLRSSWLDKCEYIFLYGKLVDDQTIQQETRPQLVCMVLIQLWLFGVRLFYIVLEIKNRNILTYSSLTLSSKPKVKKIHEEYQNLYRND